MAHRAVKHPNDSSGGNINQLCYGSPGIWTGTGYSPPLRKIVSTMVEPNGDGIIVVDIISMENTSAVPTRVMMSMGCSPATAAGPPGSTVCITTRELGPDTFGICEASIPSTGTGTGAVTVIGGTLHPMA